jgi:hypothetical protein
MRPREQATDYHQEHLYALEDPYGYTDAESVRAEYNFVKPNRYKYFERPKQSQGAGGTEQGEQRTEKYERFSGYDGRQLGSMQKEYVRNLSSLYGFTWRGIKRPHDGELGIAGGELIVLDLRTNEVLGVRRGFIRSGRVRNLTGIWWMTGSVCPRYEDKAFSKDFDFSYWFISKVLKTR